MATRVADFDEERVRAYVAMFGLSVSESQVRELTEAVSGAFEGLPRLWGYDLADVDTAVIVPTEGRR